MACYVDPAAHPFGNMVMCHLWADTLDELLAMVDRIGVQRKWIQGHPTLSFGKHRDASWVHFDIAKSKRALAVKCGAIETDKFGPVYHVRRLRELMEKTDHSDRAHARFAPSAAHRWMRCHGSIAASEGTPDKPSKYAEEGTQCHEASADILEGKATYDKAVARLDGTQEFVVSEYTNYIFGTIDKLQDRFDRVEVAIEQRMHAPDIHRDFFGTGDVRILAGRTLGFFDLKAGSGRVDVRSEDGKINKQLGSYLLLALSELGVPVGPFDGPIDLDRIGVDTIRMTIIQPRVFPKPQTTIVTAAELEEFRDELCDAIGAIEGGDTTRHAGDWCRFCPARGICPTLRSHVNEKARIVFGEVQNFPLAEWAAIAAEAALVAAHVNGALEHIRRALEKGHKVAGWKLVPKRAIKKWRDEDEAKRQILPRAGDDALKHALLTPAAMITLFRTKKIKFDLSDLYSAESSGPTLARADDPRPEYIVKPGEVFADYDTEEE